MNKKLVFNSMKPKIPFKNIQILYVCIGLLLWIPVAKGQQAYEFFCPAGPTVRLDTITFAPDQPLPFDRCFSIVITLPNNTTIDRFAITPIDKNGESDFRLRDRNIFLRNVFKNKAERDLMESSFRLPSFKGNPFLQIFEITKKIPKGKNVELYLSILPLDPGREYKLTLIGNDDEAFKDVLTISNKIIEGQLKKVTGDMQGYNNILEETTREHVKSVGKAKMRNSIRFARGYIADYGKRITQFTLNADFNETIFTKMHYLFFVPDGDLPLTLNQALADTATKSNRITPSPGNSPRAIKILLPKKDSKGNQINPFQLGKYTLQLLSVNEDTSKHTLKGLGVFELLKQGNSFTYAFTPDPQTSKSVFVELNQNNPLAQFSKITSSTATIAGLPTTLTDSKIAAPLQFLLTQASICPCEGKGIKDLTQKDDLMRVISVLYDNDPAIIKNSLLGLISLKNPLAQAVDSQKYSARSANLSISLGQLNDLMEFARKEETYHSAQAGQIKALLQYIQTLHSNLTTAKKECDEIIKAHAQLQDEFKDSFGLVTTQPITQGSTSVLNLVSETKFRIAPDFGFVALFKGDKLYTFQDFTPYLGFQIGFRPIDKNIPFRLIRNKSLWHRLSFMSGITLKSLKIENQREDFFGNNSLITGFGFRFNNWLRATTGTVWFKAVEPNPLSTNKPARFSPFVGLSIDLELQDLFGGIAKLFK